MPVFFDGRLYISPATMSRVDDTAMANRNLSVANILTVVGKAKGGAPKTVLRFGSPAQARATLRSGDLLDCVLAAFDPSPETGAAAEVVAMRVDPALRASLNLLDGSSGTAIALASTDYGLWTNAIKVKVESGTTRGKKITVQCGNDYFTDDNIGRNAFTVQYSGAQATGVVSVTNSTLTLSAPTGTPVATINLADYPTVQELVDRINVVTNWTAAVTDGSGEAPTVSALDTLTNADAKTAARQVTADLQACVDWFNSTGEGFVTATRGVSAGLVPANIAFTYLSGGTDGTATNTDWSDAYTALQAADVQWVVPASSDPAIHAMNDAHVRFMSTVGRMERRGICGTPLSTSDVAAIALAKALNSDRTSLVHLGHYDYDLKGNLVLYAPFVTAARIAGAFAGSDPGTPMTNKAITARGLERKLRNPTDTDQLLLGGVMPIEDTETGFRVVQSITTWLTNRNYNRREVSTGVALDFTVRNVRRALDVLRGAKGDQRALNRAVAIAETTLRELARPEPEGPGVLAGNATHPAYRNITATLEGDVLRISFECSPVIPINYIPVTVYAVPFTGTSFAATA